jgi:hypothetical protein
MSRLEQDDRAVSCAPASSPARSRSPVGLLLQFMNAPGAQCAAARWHPHASWRRPVARVVVSIVGYIRARDWTFATLTAIVLLELLASAVAALVFNKRL